ncbi:MAG: hypothetical protein JXM71_05895 [Spirochaetales bacterium]|nr:hypothetical protein [Spirochaetales bacterium]
MTLIGPAGLPTPVGEYLEYDVVVRSCVSVDRNLRGLPFSHALDEEGVRATGTKLGGTARAAGFDVARASDLDGWYRASLAERGLYSRPYLLNDDSLVALAPDRRIWAAFNDTSHLSLRSSSPGLDLEGPWNSVSDADDAFQAAVGDDAWAFDADLGYTMAEAAFCGSGLSGSVTIHAPALVISGLAETAFKRAMEAGFVLSGAYSGLSSSEGALFGIALPKVYRDPERAALGRLSAVVKVLVEYERRARSRLLEQSPWEALDVVGRAYGRARGAWLVSRDEGADIISGLRLGLATGILEGGSLEAVTDLWVASGLSTRHGAVAGLGGRVYDEAERQSEPESAKRARELRLAVAGMSMTKRYGDV